MVRAPRPHLLDVGHDLVVQYGSTGRRRNHDHYGDVVPDQRDRPVLQLAGGESLGVHVGELFEFQGPPVRPGTRRDDR